MRTAAAAVAATPTTADRMDDEKIDNMDMMEAADWLEQRDIPYEHMVNLEEMRLRIRQVLAEQNHESDREVSEPSSLTDVSLIGVSFVCNSI